MHFKSILKIKKLSSYLNSLKISVGKRSDLSEAVKLDLRRKLFYLNTQKRF
jgi:hypothetical protein